MGPGDSERVLAQVVREERAAVIGAVARTVGDLDLAEDAVQDAVADALRGWPRLGIPDEPAAWLTSVARRRAIDRLRRDRSRETRELRVAEDPAEHDDPDRDLLALILACCHPALTLTSRVALTLRTVGGLTTEEVARAFLVEPPTMGQRIARAKATLRETGVAFELPDDDALTDRLSSVLAVVYLVFNEGYAATGGDHLVRAPLVREAIALAEQLVRLLPDEPEVLGLTALLHLQNARSGARVTRSGEVVLLEDQDRSRWDRDAVARGAVLLRRAEELRRPGRYQLEAAIAAAHSLARSWEETDWRGIATLYDRLGRLHDTPVVALNRAVAIAMAGELDEALRALDGLEDELDGYHPFHTTRAELLARAGRPDAARSSFERAIALTRTRPEAEHLRRRLRALTAS